jgi:IS30 family transposase
MTLVERMDIFRLLYIERRRPSSIATVLNRRPSSITRELEKGLDKGMYNPILAEAQRKQRPGTGHGRTVRGRSDLRESAEATRSNAEKGL